jgi:type II secretory pathway predicted ATPase ExeA
VLDEQIHLPLKIVLANMPNVRRKLFQTGYTLEEFERIEINTTDQDLNFSDQEDTISNYAEDGTIVNSFSRRLPDYVLIEAQQGKIIECYSLRAKH